MLLALYFESPASPSSWDCFHTHSKNPICAHSTQCAHNLLGTILRCMRTALSSKRFMILLTHRGRMHTISKYICYHPSIFPASPVKQQTARACMLLWRSFRCAFIYRHMHKMHHTRLSLISYCLPYNLCTKNDDADNIVVALLPVVIAANHSRQSRL